MKLKIAVDSREKKPYTFDDTGIETIRRPLNTGDYSVMGFEDRIAIERKSTVDFLNSLTQGHERFFAEIERLSELEYRWVLIEDHWSNYIMSDLFYLIAGRKNINQNAVLGMISTIQIDYNVPIIFAGDRPEAVAWTRLTLQRFWKKYGDNELR